MNGQLNGNAGGSTSSQAAPPDPSSGNWLNPGMLQLALAAPVAFHPLTPHISIGLDIDSFITLLFNTQHDNGGSTVLQLTAPSLGEHTIDTVAGRILCIADIRGVFYFVPGGFMHACHVLVSDIQSKESTEIISLLHIPTGHLSS